ncbi:EamA family transporter [Niveispirillum sp.]|uniref:DMT family transporter n=1 Tax=Niveispirillum sp. TaxID=1917217 RepID=UPI001B4ADA3E|nr:EamA family transporter [Niveispirillum sp.]MBP7336416.1 EamA family transporter [Niveispirillum sp.]
MPVNIALFFASVLIWGSTWYAITFQLGATHPAVSVAFRFLLAGVALLCWLAIRRQPILPRREGLVLIAAAGLLNFSINYFMVYKATALLPSGLVAVAGSVMSLMNVVNARLFLGQPIRPPVLVGGLMGVAGVLLLFTPELDGKTLTGGALAGFGLMMVSNYSASLGNMVVSKTRKAEMPLIGTTAWSMLVGAVIMAGVAAGQGASFVVVPSVPYFLSLAYLALFGSIAAFLCYFTLLGRIGPGRAGYVAIMTPVVALVISTLFEDYHWTSAGIAGLLLAILGNFLVMAPASLGRLRRRQPA